MFRYWLVLAALALCGCKHAQKSESLRIDPAFEKLIPADTVFIAGANVESIRNTVTYQKFLSRVPLPQLDNFTSKTGLDPRKDISQILSCSNGKNGLFMARGDFHTKDLEARLIQQGATQITYKGRNFFGAEATAILFLNSSIAVAGSAPELRAVVDGSGSGMPAALRDLVRSIPANDQIWGATLTGEVKALNLSVPENSNLSNVLQVFKTIDNATIGMDLTSGFDLLAVVTCKTEGDAKFVHDMVKGVVGFGRLRTPDKQPELLKLYDAIQVTQQQTRAQVAANIPIDLADKFFDLWLKR
jgi:hypothetical protein